MVINKRKYIKSIEFKKIVIQSGFFITSKVEVCYLQRQREDPKNYKNRDVHEITV